MPPVIYSLRSVVLRQTRSSICEQALVAGLRGHVGDAGHQVSRADGVALDVLMVVDRHIVLPVRAVVFVQRRVVFGGKELPAAVLDEEAGELEVALVAGGAPELDQGQLDLRDAPDSPGAWAAGQTPNQCSRHTGWRCSGRSSCRWPGSARRRPRTCGRRSRARGSRAGWSSACRVP